MPLYLPPQGPGWHWLVIFQLLCAGGAGLDSTESPARVPDQSRDAQRSG